MAALTCRAASSDVELERGLVLARAGHAEQARRIFETAAIRSPRDKRFPLELAGLDYQRKNFAAARRHLRRALALDPEDRYANDFLATLYFLEGNLPAALRYWNRIGKPKIDDMTITPEPKLGRVLLGQAFDFSPAGILRLDQYRNTRAWLDSLDVLGPYRLEIAARPEEHFDAALHWLAPPRWMKAASMLRGIAYQTVQPEIRDIGGKGLNWTGLWRWDARKRRMASTLSGPLGRDPRWRFLAYGDARQETWNIGGPADFRMQRITAGAEVRAVPNWRLSWRSGLELSARRFTAAPDFRGGTALKYIAGIDYALVRDEERHLTLASGATWEIARVFSGAGALYARTQGSVEVRWREMHTQIRGGEILGHAPFDEWYQLGIERDNDLWLRGHAGTLDGKKGSAPIGRRYLLANWDISKNVYKHALFALQAGPLLDAARIDDAFARFEGKRWLVDAGAQVRALLPGGLSITMSYGRDLRGGGKALYTTVTAR